MRKKNDSRHHAAIKNSAKRRARLVKVNSDPHHTQGVIISIITPDHTYIYIQYPISFLSNRYNYYTTYYSTALYKLVSMMRQINARYYLLEGKKSSEKCVYFFKQEKQDCL